LSNPQPEYPAAAKRRRQAGQVILLVQVSAGGVPMQVRVATGSGFELLDDAARDAVQNWKFVPARRNGQAIAAELQVPIMFQLES
jgi:periplasmic protein TonB